ncbi:MAG: hypothetical protein U9N02_01555 [Campylobacterota bacterium]|nr:hypothetical protein [Campylobacterota bacterium]
MQDKKIIDKLKSKYILLHLDRDFDDYPVKFNAKRVPSHFFVTSNEDLIYKFPGYWNSRDFISFLKDINSK